MTAAATQAPVVKTVLIDDTPDIRLLLKIALERTGGFSVVAEAGDGVTGVREVRTHQPDVVVLDLAMPVMDGLEALPLIRSAAPDSLVVVLSGFENTKMAHTAMDNGAASYLQKGAPLDEIVSKLRDLLAARGRTVVHGPTATAVLRETPSELERIRVAMAVAAHEMRNPLYVMMGMADMLATHRHSMDDATIDRMLDSISREGRVLNQVTQDLLTTTQVQQGRLSVDVDSIDLLTVLEASVKVAQEYGETLVTCPVGLRVRADKIRLQQMLTNLLTNAMKYGGRSARIVVHSVGGFAEIQVIDHGPGVPDDFQATMFDEFTRADGVTAAGMGLGLHIVRALAEAHGGRAWHVPTPGGGATFCITVPLAEPEPLEPS